MNEAFRELFPDLVGSALLLVTAADQRMHIFKNSLLPDEPMRESARAEGASDRRNLRPFAFRWHATTTK